MRKAAFVGLSVVVWPVGFYLAIRWSVENGIVYRFRWRNLRPGHLLWAGFAVTLLTIGLLPPWPRERAADDFLTLAWLACITGLIIRHVRLHGQQRWRETGGRMTPTPRADADRGRWRSGRPTLAEQVAANAAELAVTKAKVNALSGGLTAAFTAAGEEVPSDMVAAAPDVVGPRPRPGYLRIVPDEEQAGA